MPKETIVLPKHLLDSGFVIGLKQPLEDVAEILDAQGRPHHALSVREAITICETFVKVNLLKEAELFQELKLIPIERRIDEDTFIYGILFSDSNKIAPFPTSESRNVALKFLKDGTTTPEGLQKISKKDWEEI